MKILQLCSKIPFPAKDGGSIAMDILTQGLIACGNDVKVFAINTPKHFTNTETIDEVYRKKTNYESVFIDTAVKPFAAFMNLFSSKSYNISRFYSQAFEKRLIEILKEYKPDIVHLETLFSSPYVYTIRKHSKVKIVLRSQNVEYALWERLAKNPANPLKRWYLNLLAARLKKYELNMLNQYNGIAAITKNDAEHFVNMGCTIPVIHSPFGVDAGKYASVINTSAEPALFHIGAMDWMPNVNGVRWFLDTIWKDVHARFPHLKLYLAGRNTPQWLKNINMNNVMVKGEVPSALHFMTDKNIMIVPLLSGGGMRIKIIEGMALGKTIISTSIGAEGIDYSNGKDILIANTPVEFTEAISKCIHTKELCASIGKNAQALVKAHYDNKVICERLSEFYKTLLQKT